MQKTFIRFFVIAAVAVTAACGGSPSPSGTAGPGGSTGPAATGIVVSLSPLAFQVAPGGSVPFSASVTGTADTAVAWSVQEGAAGGSVTTSGVYAAPASVGTYHVVAAAHADPTKFQVATVSVVGAPPAGVSILPASTTLDACGSITFRSTVGGSDNPAPSWSVKEGPAGGTVTSGGVYTAPSAAGTYHVVASNLASPGPAVEAAVVVGPEKVLSVAVTPGSASVTPSGAVALAATVTTSCGSFAAQ